MLRSLLAKDYMTADPLAFTPDLDVLDAIHQLLQHELPGAPVIDGKDALIGYLSEKDALKVALSAAYYEQLGGTVREFMHQSVVSIDAETSLIEAAEIFLAHPYRCLPVAVEGRLVGQLSRADILRALETMR
jgi:CBS domain-containing protein